MNLSLSLPFEFGNSHAPQREREREREIKMASKLCDSCKSSPSTVFCRADSAFLCLTCDSEIHAANKLASRHERVWVCEVCEQAPAHVTCKADAAALCVTCDLDIHSANPLARRHERVPVTPFFEGGSSLPHPPGNFFPEEEEEEAEAASWLLPNPNNNNNNNNIHNTNNNNKMMVEDPYLDLEYCVKEEEEEDEEEADAVDQEGNSWGSDGVVPVQSGVGLVGGGGGVSVFNCYGFNTTPCFSNTVSSSSLDVGVVPDGADISNPYSNHQQSTNQTVPLSGVDREARVMRYREKRKNRRFEKTIRYASRKAYAETRPRIKGRFAKRTDIDTTSSTSLDADDATAALFGFGVVPSFSHL